MSNSRTQLATHLRREVDHTLAAMRKSAALNLNYENGRAIWRLTPGPFVTPTAAKIVIGSNDVVASATVYSPVTPARLGDIAMSDVTELVDGANGRAEVAA
jgi:hypothetical protein